MVKEIILHSKLAFWKKSEILVQQVSSQTKGRQVILLKEY